jgi:hypothetical protein
MPPLRTHDEELSKGSSHAFGSVFILQLTVLQPIPELHEQVQLWADSLNKWADTPKPDYKLGHVALNPYTPLLKDQRALRLHGGAYSEDIFQTRQDVGTFLQRIRSPRQSNGSVRAREVRIQGDESSLNVRLAHNQLISSLLSQQLQTSQQSLQVLQQILAEIQHPSKRSSLPTLHFDSPALQLIKEETEEKAKKETKEEIREETREEINDESNWETDEETDEEMI